MTFKILVMILTLATASFASAVQKTSYPLDKVVLTFNASENKVFVSGTLISGKPLKNGVSSVIVNSSTLRGKFEVDAEAGWIRLALPKSGAFLVGVVKKSGEVILDVPFKAYQISERYDAIEQSFGAFDVDYIALDIKL